MISDYYREQYRIDMHGTAEVVQEELDRERSRARRLFGVLRQHIAGRLDSMLDIGSSAGVLLSEFHKIYGCEVLGVEPNDKYREYAIAHGVPTVADISQVAKRYSLVTAIHVLEHVKDPVGLIDRDADWLCVEVPLMNVNTGHIIMYDDQLLHTVIRYAGWEPVTVHEYGKSKMIVVARRHG